MYLNATDKLWFSSDIQYLELSTLFHGGLYMSEHAWRPAWAPAAVNYTYICSSWQAGRLAMRSVCQSSIYRHRQIVRGRWVGVSVGLGVGVRGRCTCRCR